GQAEVGGDAVGLGEDGDGLDAEVLAGADDPQGDLAPVGDKDALEHAHPAGSMRNRTVPYSTGCAFSTHTSMTTPLHSAWISLNSFIASIRPTTVVCVTFAPTLT